MWGHVYIYISCIHIIACIYTILRYTVPYYTVPYYTLISHRLLTIGEVILV